MRAIWTIQMLGELATEQANYDEAQKWLEEALAIADEIGDRHSIARLFGCLGHCHLGLEDLDAARHFAEQYLVGSRQLGDRAGICYSLADLGEIARLHGDLGAARTLLEESIEAIPEGTDPYSLLIALHRLGGVPAWKAISQTAANLELRSLRLAVQANDVANISQILEGLAELAAADEDHERAVFLFSVSAANRTKFGVPIPPYLRQGARRHARAEPHRPRRALLRRDLGTWEERIAQRRHRDTVGLKSRPANASTPEL